MKKNKNIVPILIVVVIVLVVVASMLLPKITLKTKNPVEGEYDCTGLDDHTDEYLISLYLYNDGTFLYGPYGKLDDNHAKGTYTYEHEKEKDGKVKD